MYRWLPAALSVVFIVGVVTLATTNAFGGGEQGDISVVKETVSSSPSATLPSPLPSPCPPCGVPTPGPGPIGVQPEQEPVVVNGIKIPVPADGTVGMVISEPGGTGHIYRRGESFVGFTNEGWIGNIFLQPQDGKYFDGTLDALFQAADSVLAGGKSFRVPRGSMYFAPILDGPPPEYSGPPDEAPWLHIVKRGESFVSFDDSGQIVEERVAAADTKDFKPVTDAISQ